MHCKRCCQYALPSWSLSSLLSRLCSRTSWSSFRYCIVSVIIVYHFKLQTSGDLWDDILCGSCSWGLSQCWPWLRRLYFWRSLHLHLLNLPGGTLLILLQLTTFHSISGNLQWYLQLLWYHHILPRQHKVVAHPDLMISYHQWELFTQDDRSLQTKF